MATSTNRITTTDNDYVMTVRYDAACTVHGGLGSWSATGTPDNHVPDESGVRNSAAQAASSHAGTCESGEW